MVSAVSYAKRSCVICNMIYYVIAKKILIKKIMREELTPQDVNTYIKLV